VFLFLFYIYSLGQADICIHGINMISIFLNSYIIYDQIYTQSQTKRKVNPYQALGLKLGVRSELTGSRIHVHTLVLRSTAFQG